MTDPDTYREAIGSFATGVTVVTFPSDPFHGLTANAVSSVSLDPPLVLVCIDHDTESYELLEAGAVDGFCVNVLAADQQHLGEYFARMRDLEESPFETEPTARGATGAPVFEESLAYLDCEVRDAHLAGDHTIYVGAVEDAAVLDEEAPGLTFFRSEWGTTE
jgi:flavin reductase (DIM6/NTAB) family NADH-FMN oxidoreductase RutF